MRVLRSCGSFLHHLFRLIDDHSLYCSYLEREHKIADHWYPKDYQARARVDEYLEWQHINTRAKCALYFLIKWLNPLITFKSPKPEKLVDLQKDMDKCLDQFETLWLSDDKKFIAGNEISVADIWAACEIEQPSKEKS